MANYPGALSSNANLYIAVNGLQTTLAVSCTNTDTTLTLTSTTGFPTTGLVTIDNTEVVSYTGIAGATITGCTRGADGTVAAAHSLGVTVGLTVVAAHHNLLKDEIIAIETALGIALANVFPATPTTGSGNVVLQTSPTINSPTLVTPALGTPASGVLTNATGLPLTTGTVGILPDNKTTATPNATASTIMERDANVNTKVNTIVQNFTTTVTAAGTTTLTAATSPIQQFTGTTTQTVKLPDATTLSTGYQITILNRSTAAVTVNNNGSVLQHALSSSEQTTFTCTNTGTANGTWDVSTSSAGSAVAQYNRFIVGTASGTYSGSTTVFDLSFAYVQDGKTLSAFYNGQMLSAANYTETSPTQVTMSTALVVGAEIVFRAFAGGATATAVTFLREDYIVGTPSGSYTGSLTVFNLTNTYTPGGSNLQVYLDGDLQTKGAGVDYLETSSSIVTFNNSLVSGQKVSFAFSQSVAPAGTVSNGTTGQVAQYAASGSTISGTSAFTVGANGPNGIVVGSNTNDAAAAGKVGEYIESVVSAVGGFGNGSWGDVTSISLTAGDWDVTCLCWWEKNGSNVNTIYSGISTTSGNSATGLVFGSNEFEIVVTDAGRSFEALTISNYRMSLASTTTVYFKGRHDYTTGTPRMSGRLSARRVR